MVRDDLSSARLAACKGRVAVNLSTETVILIARFVGIVEGIPPQFAFTKLLTQPGGKCKIHSQYVPVTDLDLLTRLQTEFQIGQEVEIVLETDWSQPDIPQVLHDVHAPDASTPVADEPVSR